MGFLDRPKAKKPKRGLKKQPKRKKKQGLKKPPKRRAQAATAAWTAQLENRPQLPPTAQKRKRRTQTRFVWMTTARLRELAFSPRLISLGILLSVVYVLWQVGNNTRFTLQNITIEGSSYLPEAEVIAASGLRDTHIFAVEPENAALALSDFPGILSAQVDVEWPNEVRITVEEEAPLLIWQENDQNYWVNSAGNKIPVIDSGVDLLRVVADVPPIVPQIEPVEAEIDDSEEPEPFDPTAIEGVAYIPDDILEGALALAAVLPKVDVLHYQPSGGLIYEDENGWLVYFGTGDDMLHKYSVYQALIAQLAAENVTPDYVNVSNKDKPFYRPSQLQQPAEG